LNPEASNAFWAMHSPKEQEVRRMNSFELELGEPEEAP